VEVRFQAKADRDAFAAALASLAAKYARERFLLGLNAWFGQRLPGLKPTAGYPQDAKRWLAEASRSGLGELRVDLITRDR
ncbi:MAG: hypothetical protein LBV15_05995, partial [Planctomycetota bacterium]|jgi:ribonuclease HII|nr:hypothetical protein [Planctomycetota bacterium]